MNARMIAEYRAVHDLPNFPQLKKEFETECGKLWASFNSPIVPIISRIIIVLPIISFVLFFLLEATDLVGVITPWWVSGLGIFGLAGILPAIGISVAIRVIDEHIASKKLKSSSAYKALLNKYEQLGYKEIEMDFSHCYDNCYGVKVCSVTGNWLSDSQLSNYCNSRNCAHCSQLMSALYD